MPEGTKAKGCVKLRRCSKFRSYYQVQYANTQRNKVRRIKRHLKHHPEDIQAKKNLDRIVAYPVLSRRSE